MVLGFYALISLLFTSKLMKAEYSMAFQLLNYSNPYFRLHVNNQEYLCMYTFYTWSPKGTVYYKCRLNFIVLIVSQCAEFFSDQPYIVTSKLINMPVDGPWKGIINFENSSQHMECSPSGIGCEKDELGKPVELRFLAKPARISVIISHYGPLADTTNRFVHSDQNFLVDRFEMDLRNHLPFDELRNYSEEGHWTAKRVRNKTLMTSLAYRYILRCAPGFYGKSCDMVECTKMGVPGYPEDMVECEKNLSTSEKIYFCLKDSSECTKHALIKFGKNLNLSSAMLIYKNGLDFDKCEDYSGYKLATLVLALMLILQTMTIFCAKMDRNNRLL